MSYLDTLSTATLRRKARKIDLGVRYYRNWNRNLGNDGYVVTNWRRNIHLTGPLDEEQLREFLVEALTE